MKWILAATIFMIFESQAETFKIGGHSVEFSSRDGVLTSGCVTKCLALDALKKHKSIELKKLPKTGFANSLGSDVCRTVYKGTSLLGVNEKKDGRAFCVFSDQSMIEINSLTKYLSSKTH